MFRWIVPATVCLLTISSSAQTRPVISPLANGVEVRQGDTLLVVTSLTDSIVRVRESNTGRLPEDSSWAVLSEARAAHVSVTPEPDGFKTSALQLHIGSDLRISVTDLAGNVIQKDAEPVHWQGSRFRIYKEKKADDHFFGLGDKPGPLDRAGQSYAMWNSDTFGWQESTDPIYKTIPFFIDFRNGKAMGVLFDNTWRSFFDFGHEFPDEYSFGAPDGPIDYYLMYGPDPKQVVADYALLTGATPLPPLWTLGFQQSRYSYETEAKLNQVADRLRADRIPSDALYMDIDYQVKNRPFTVDERAFPSFPAFEQKLKKQNFHLVLITDLHIADLPNKGYAPYDSGAAGDHFLKKPDGSTYVGQVWPGPSVFPDFTQSTTRAWWGTLYRQFVADGVAGFWNDMNEPAIFGTPSKTMPDDIQHRIDEPGFHDRTAGHLEIHNVYGMENSRATYDGLLTLRPEERPFVLTRATYAGGQRFAATWTGDNSSTWNHLRMTTPQLLNLGLSGFSLSGADVGGFAGSPSPDLLTKWIELAAFQPIDRDHAAKGTRDHEVWVDGPAQEAIRRRFIEERYRLMPYLYTTAEETSHDGMPIVRPLFLEFPAATQDGHPFDLDAPGEFLFGPSLLVVPNPSPEEVAPYEVYLPPGLWYDYWTGMQVHQDAKAVSTDAEQRDAVLQRKPIMISPTLAELPVYARGGSVIPMAPLTQSTNEKPSGPLTLRVYLDSFATSASGTLCKGEVYLDDGISFAFRRGEYLRQRFTCRKNQDGSISLIVDKQEGTFHPWWTALRFEIFGLPSGFKTAVVAQNRITLKQTGGQSVVEAPAGPAGTEFVLR